MSHEVKWNRRIYETFCHEAMLNDMEKKILETRINGWSRTKQSIELHISLSTLDKTIKSLKLRYDDVQKHNPVLPKRKTSKEEEWMDTH